MDQFQLLLRHEMVMATQRELSRVAHVRHVRAEQARQARDARPSTMSFITRAWAAIAEGTRRSIEPTALANR